MKNVGEIVCWWNYILVFSPTYRKFLTNIFHQHHYSRCNTSNPALHLDWWTLEIQFTFERHQNEFQRCFGSFYRSVDPMMIPCDLSGSKKVTTQRTDIEVHFTSPSNLLLDIKIPPFWVIFNDSWKNRVVHLIESIQFHRTFWGPSPTVSMSVHWTTRFGSLFLVIENISADFKLMVPKFQS